MILQTGGSALAATSTRSRPTSRAAERASGRGFTPSCDPSAPIRRTWRARMRSLMRASSVAIAASPLRAGPSTRIGGGRFLAVCGSVHRHTGMRRTGIGPGTTSSTRWGPALRACRSHFRFQLRCKDTSVSGLWTPGGGEPEPEAPAGAREPSPEEVAALRELHARLSSAPVIDVILNHALGIWQLALVHLGVMTPPDEQGRVPAPDLASAGVAIDALRALVDG